MDNNNYMTIEEYVKNNSQNDRQSHIDLTTPCQKAYSETNNRYCKKGDVLGVHASLTRAKENLKKFLNLTGSTSSKIHTCHTCQNDSSGPNGFVCINEHHLYFGTHSENMMDKPVDDRKKGGKISGKLPASEKAKKIAAKTLSKTSKKLLKEGRHNTQQSHYCDRCNKTLRGLKGKSHVDKGTKSCPI